MGITKNLNHHFIHFNSNIPSSPLSKLFSLFFCRPKRWKIYFIFIALFSFFFIQIGKSSTPQLPDGNGLPYELREVDTTFFTKYYNDPDFFYDLEYKGTIKETWLQRLLGWIFQRFEGVGKIIGAPVSKYIFLGLLAALLIYLIIGTKIYKVFYSNPGLENMQYTEHEIEDAPLDLDKAITDEIEQGNYRKAIRYCYIKLIRQLDLYNIISFSKDKTNRDYYHEIENDGLKTVFIGLTDIYNNVWYGNRMIGKEDFSQYADEFNKTYGRLNGQEK